MTNAADLLRPKWHGQPGRVEVQYLTATDSATGTGLWVHHEVVAPIDAAPYAHGWTAVFPPNQTPQCERFGPSPVESYDDANGVVFRCDDVVMTATSAQGKAGDLSWDVQWEDNARPLYTFPRYTWERQLLPAAQIVPVPSTAVTGSVAGAPYNGNGAVAHIYGHGNAQRWVWLHCDLGGGGDVLEIVAATGRRPGLRVLPRLPLVQLRVAGEDWPGDPLAAGVLFRAKVSEHRFVVRGVVGRRRLHVTVDLPAEQSVALTYTDPDGATATCTNSERATAQVRLDQLTRSGWRCERQWSLPGTAHAEIGTRP